MTPSRSVGAAGPDFLPRVESLRGLAALSVAVWHSLIWLTVDGNREIWAISFFEANGATAGLVRFVLAILNGAAAVDIFFVLSGFVLALSLQKTPLDGPVALTFYVRRFLRIYPAYAASLLVVFLMLQTRPGGFHEFPVAAEWFGRWYRQPATPGDYALNLTMYHFELNHVAWTLRVELMLSLIFPGLYFACRHGGRWGNWLLGAGLIGLVVFPISGALRFAFMFFAGIQVCLNGRAIAAKFDAAGLTPVAIWTCIAVFFVQGLFSVQHELVSDLVYGSAAFGLVLLCAYANIPQPFRLLESRPVRFLGKISYSFYLLHFLVMYPLAFQVLVRADEHMLADHPVAVMLATGVVSIALAIPLAAASQRWIEQPFVKLGRTTIARFNRG